MADASPTSAPSSSKGLDRAQSKALREWAFATGDKASSLWVYRLLRRTVRSTLFPFFRMKSEGAATLDLPGATILTPVHRSNLDSVLLACLCERRIRALGKESLFTVPVLKYFCAALGAIPVRRGQADREALTAAKTLLDRGESMIVFPEGGRQAGHDVGELFDGAAWLAGKTKARVVPVGIVGTAEALGEGSKMLKRASVAIVVGDPIAPPVGPDGKRADRDQLRQFTADLRTEIQRCQDRAQAIAAS